MDKALEYQILKNSTSGKIHISFSEYSKYQNCGHRHLIEKYLKLVEEPPSIHLIFGNSIHKAIEIGIKSQSDMEKRVLTFREDFYKEMHDKLNGTPDMNDFNAFMEQGENIVRYLSTEKILKKYDIIGVEFALYENIFYEFYFKGFIDLIVRDKITGRYIIIDWKTSGEAWDVPKKKKDQIFMAQMRLYKYFFSRRQNIPMDEIDCKYVVLNRLKNKKYPELGFGEIQTVEIFSNEDEIMYAIKSVASTLRKIHIENYFPKSKLIGQTKNCFFCPYKDNIGLCNSSETQGQELIKEQRTILLEKSANSVH